ncbi:Dps family protein [Schaalia vaccimaxillae]|uniref:Dps family protein n=1 Tax=Schaalia vaccimaxillae TaxID=183916 RepID=UPI0003B4EBC3|nr:DNA starvation/stationary phase protection protein [Schaalia vaccimaxillae]
MTVESTGFKGSDVLSADLQKVLTDVTALSLVGKQLHWNIVGQGFRSLHLYLDEVVAIAREASDEVAERMRAIQLTPDGRPSVVAQETSLPKVAEGVVSTEEGAAQAVAAINATVATMRDVHEKVDGEDPTSGDILVDYIGRLEQQAWFIRSLNEKA